MAFPFIRILCPMDFDENAITALTVAGQIARQNDGTVFVFHVVPMFIPPDGMPVYVDLYKDQEKVAQEKLKEIAKKHLPGIKYELLTHIGEPQNSILQAQRRLPADLIVMSTHGRRGFSRVFMGSVAETIVREATCPVLTVRYGQKETHTVGHWMTTNPVTVGPQEKLAAAQAKMQQGQFRSIPVTEKGKVVGIVTDRDVREHAGTLEQTEVKSAMSSEVQTVTPQMSVWDAARLLRERKIGALPVLEDGRLVGVISTSDILGAFTELQ